MPVVRTILAGAVTTFLSIGMIGMVSTNGLAVSYISALTDSVAPAPVYDTDYQLILDRATALGYVLPSDAVKAAGNQLILTLKDLGIWAILDVLYIFATDGSSDFATLNWKNPLLYQCLKVNNPTFLASQGFQGDATSMYLDTQWSPGSAGNKYLLGNAHAAFYTPSGIANNTWVDYGVIHTNGSTTSRLLCLSRLSSSTSSSIALNSVQTGTTTNITTGTGFFLQTRLGTAASDHKWWQNNILKDSSVASASVLANQSLYLLCNRGSTGNAVSFSGRIMSMFSAGAGIPNSQEINYYNAWITYRNVFL
jgi:hypothetical protein